MRLRMHPRAGRRFATVAVAAVLALVCGVVVAVAVPAAEAATVDTGAWYVLVNRNSGKALEVQNASTADNANIVQYADWGGNNQQWQLVKVA